MPKRKVLKRRVRKRVTVHQKQGKGGTQVSVLIDQRKTTKARKPVVRLEKELSQSLPQQTSLSMLAHPPSSVSTLVPPAVSNLERGMLKARQIEQDKEAKTLKEAFKQLEEEKQNFLTDTALRKASKLLQNDISKKTFTKGGSPAMIPDVSLTPSSLITVGVEKAKAFLKANKTYMPTLKVRKKKTRQYTDTEIDDKQANKLQELYHETKRNKQIAEMEMLTPTAIPVQELKHNVLHTGRKLSMSNYKQAKKLGIGLDVLPAEFYDEDVRKQIFKDSGDGEGGGWKEKNPFDDGDY